MVSSGIPEVPATLMVFSVILKLKLNVLLMDFKHYLCSQIVDSSWKLFAKKCAFPADSEFSVEPKFPLNR